MVHEFDSKVLGDAPLTTTAPWYFRLGRFLSKRRIRGGDRLLIEARKRGLLDRLVVYALVDDVQLLVPLWRPCNAWDADDVRGYEATFVSSLSRAIRTLPGRVTLIDCGADIGTVSVHLVARCKNIVAVEAFEPNRAAHAVLAQNLRGLPVRARAHQAAVGDFCGMGRLVSPPEDQSAHAMYIVPDEGGTIIVERVDELGLAPWTSCVIKIDVEGSEQGVIAGAARTIREAGSVVVAFEAHPRVAQRTRRDPSRSCGPCSRSAGSRSRSTPCRSAR